MRTVKRAPALLKAYDGQADDRIAEAVSISGRAVVRAPIGAQIGRLECYDYEHRRNGTRNLFVFCEPKGGWRHIAVTERRAAVGITWGELGIFVSSLEWVRLH